MTGIEKAPQQNIEHLDAQLTGKRFQEGLDVAAELAVDMVTAPMGLGTVELPETEAEDRGLGSTEVGAGTAQSRQESDHPREKLSLGELQSMLGEYELGGETPRARVEALKKQPKETFATFLTDLNRRLQGSNDTLIHDDTVKIGDKATVAPEERYDLFTSIYEKIQNSDESINPARIGDALALTTVMLHPFKDGNGRTARMIGYIYRADFSKSEERADFDQLAEPRDEARERGGFVINGYVPRLGEEANQSDPAVIDEYISRVLHEEADDLYTGPYGQAPLQGED